MQDLNEGKLLKLVSPFEFVVQDAKDQAVIKIQVRPTQHSCLSHLLPRLANQNVGYALEKRKSQKIREQFSKGTVYLGGCEITSLYLVEEGKVYRQSQAGQVNTLECFVSKVECLKLELISLVDLEYITFYFSELKLIRVGNIHPKQMWERSQSYFKSEIEGEFIELTVAGSENYKEEVNIFGDIVRIRDRQNIREKTIKDGYAELSKDALKYLNEETVSRHVKWRNEAKESNLGSWETSRNIGKSNMQVQEFKYNQWEEWIKENKQISRVKNEEEEFRAFLQELCQVSRVQGKLEHGKLKIILEALISLFLNQTTKRHFRFLDQIVKLVCLTLSNLQLPFYHQTDSLDHIKSVNKMLVFLVFYHEELEKVLEGSKEEKAAKTTGLDFQKCVRFIFKLCFLGNETFHDKLFGKKKENNYENFNFEHAYLSGGFSSLSDCSDYEDADKLSREQKKQRKLQSARQKIRINSTHVLSFLFKHYPNIVESHWEMCVTSNVLTRDFLSHITKLRITTSEVRMEAGEKKEIVSLMGNNFGDPSLVLLSFFERNSRVKSNSITCLLNMISNFQGKKLIATTESVYIQKLLTQTKSSFVPKSFIIFSGLRNALYFLLFVLYYERSLPIVILVFKTLCELCNNCTLVDKMSFEEGMGLLLRNYIVPVLEFEWSISELEELKVLIINFLSVLMNSNRRWPEIEQTYLKSSSSNINSQLMCVMSHRKASPHHFAEDRVVVEIMNYFTKLCKHYYSVLFYRVTEAGPSIWQYLQTLFLGTVSHSYTQFVEEVFKANLDQAQALSQPSNRTQREASVATAELSGFLVQFLKVYSKDSSPSNFMNLLGIITYVDYGEWSKPEFDYAKRFLLHCFYSFVDQKQQQKQKQKQRSEFPPIHDLKNNNFVRIALMKLIGYMSFCPEFQTDEIMKQSVNCLLDLSRHYKSLNSTVKLSWGLSNWSKVPNFSSALSESELRACLDYMVSHSGSDKEKIASNCTRGIGFFVANVGKQFNLRDCRKHIIKNLSHPVLKVRTNSSKTLISLAEELTEEEVEDLLPLLELNILKNNYHLQMESLQLLKRLGNPLQAKRLLGIFVAILKNLMNSTTIGYQFSEIRTVRQLRFTVLSELFQISSQIEDCPELSKDIVSSICEFLIRDCKDKQSSPESNEDMIKREFQKSEEAETLIFNKRGVEKFNDDRAIETQVMIKGFVYRANPQELQLVQKIKECSQVMKESEPWAKLRGLRVEGSTILIDFSALQVGEHEDDYTYIVME